MNVMIFFAYGTLHLVELYNIGGMGGRHNLIVVRREHT